jgi:8-oxo-dGTP diphosphatase
MTGPADRAPTFGTRVPGARYELRDGAYAVIRDAQGRVAVVASDGKRFLPGGGCRDGESPPEALTREVREECGCGAVIQARLGDAVQYFTAGDRHLELRGTFFDAAFVDEGEPGSGEHELQWHERGQAQSLLYHESHAWAVGVSRSSLDAR